MTEEVILVDAADNVIGTMEKMDAHKQGMLHRAFSVFVFNRRGELLLQRRAAGKYHSGGLWTNTCCSHPRPGEPTETAAHRRLQEEMGFDCPLRHVFSFTYSAELGNSLREHELDHVYFGLYEGAPQLNAQEADAWQYISLPAVRTALQENPAQFTEWFRICLGEVERHHAQFFPQYTV